MFEVVIMQRIRVACVVAGLMISGVALAQGPAAPAGPTGPAAEVQRSYAAVKANILKSADKMPAADYSYKPTADVRTYARVLNHVTEAQGNSCGAANGTAVDARVKAPAETADKAAIVTALNASFAECDKAFAALTDANALEMVDLDGEAVADRADVGDVAT